MADQPGERPPDLTSLTGKLAESPYSEDLKVTIKRRETVYRHLAESKDPILRELGQQLRDGAMTPRDILRVPDYMDAAFRGLRPGHRESFIEALALLEQHVDGRVGDRAVDRRGM